MHTTCPCSMIWYFLCTSRNLKAAAHSFIELHTLVLWWSSSARLLLGTCIFRSILTDLGVGWILLTVRLIQVGTRIGLEPEIYIQVHSSTGYPPKTENREKMKKFNKFRWAAWLHWHPLFNVGVSKVSALGSVVFHWNKKFWKNTTEMSFFLFFQCPRKSHLKALASMVTYRNI